MKYAIIGCGKFGKYHLKTLLENGKDVKYVCNKTDSKFRDIQTEFCLHGEKNMAVQFTTDYSVVLNDPEVTVVSITTGPHQHYELVKAALNAGKHVVCEKPFVFTVEQSKELYDLSKEKKLVLLVHYSPIFSAKLIRNNFFKTVSNSGEKDIISIFYQNFGCGPDRGDEYSVIWDYGCHIASFAYCCSAIKYQKSLIWRFDSVLKGFISSFINYNKNIEINAQFGNCFSSRMHGLTCTIPTRLVNPEKEGSSTYMVDLSKEKTLDIVYGDIEYYISDLDNYFKNFDFYKTVSSFVIAFCIDLENSVNKNENTPI